MEKMIVMSQDQMNAKGTLLSESETRTMCKVTHTATSKNNADFSKYAFEGQKSMWIDNTEVLEAAIRANRAEQRDGKYGFNATSFEASVEGGTLIMAQAPATETKTAW